MLIADDNLLRCLGSFLVFQPTWSSVLQQKNWMIGSGMSIGPYHSMHAIVLSEQSQILLDPDLHCVLSPATLLRLVIAKFSCRPRRAALFTSKCKIWQSNVLSHEMTSENGIEDTLFWSNKLFCLSYDILCNALMNGRAAVYLTHDDVEGLADRSTL